MELLILGGGVFLGAAALESALAGGHRVTVFNRGRSRRTWPAGVEVLTGDRSVDLSELDGRVWDAVIDTCGYVPADVRASAQALRACGAYLFVSSVSVYATSSQLPLKLPVSETDPLAPVDGIVTDDRDLKHYGPQKAACEAEVRAVFCDRALIVRPGLIVGPGDRSGRFSHWPWRVAAGGEMLVPDMADNATDSEPLQFIDVRDLGAWMVSLIEPGARVTHGTHGTRGTHDTFNATGPAGGTAIGWNTLLAACRAEAAARGLAPATPVRVSEAFLLQHAVQPWSELPLWLPSTEPKYAGFNRIDLTRAMACGLHTRPLRETVGAVLDEGLPEPDDKRRAGKLTPHREAQLLAAWSAGAATSMPTPVALELVRPSAAHLPGYVAALRRGWSPDNLRGAAAAADELQQIAADAAEFLAGMNDREAAGGPITLPDGSQVARLPGLRRWLWDGEFCGSIGFRWRVGAGPLPPHVLGHIGYAVVPWKQRRGYATRALALLLPEARAEGLACVDITTDPDNIASQRVITANGGVLVERFHRPAAYGGTPGLRYRITL